MARPRDSGAYVIWAVTLGYGIAIGGTNNVILGLKGALLGAILLLLGVRLARSERGNRAVGALVAAGGISFYTPLLADPDGMAVLLASAAFLGLAARGQVETIVYGSQLLALPGSLLASQASAAHGLLGQVYSVAATAHLGVWVTGCRWCRSVMRAYEAANTVIAYLAFGSLGAGIVLADWLLLRELVDKVLEGRRPRPRTLGLVETARMTLFYILLLRFAV